MTTRNGTKWTVVFSTVVALAASSAAAAGVDAVQVSACGGTTIVVRDAISNEEVATRIAKRIRAAERFAANLRPQVLEAYVREALQEGDVDDALQFVRRLPAVNCNFVARSNGVLRDQPGHAPPAYLHEWHLPRPRNCTLVRLLHVIASSPAAVHRVDWLREVKSLADVSNSSKATLLTSLAVTQARAGDVKGALVTAGGHRLFHDDVEKPFLNEVTTMVMIAVAITDVDPARALELVKAAKQECSSPAWCSPTARSGYRGDLEFGFALVAMAFADGGNFRDAGSVIQLAEKEAGDGDGWLSRARGVVAIALAEAGRPFEAVYMTDSIPDTDIQIQTRQKVESVLGEQRRT